MADTDEFQTLGDADTDVLETLKHDEEELDEDCGFDPYNNTARSKIVPSSS